MIQLILPTHFLKIIWVNTIEVGCFTEVLKIITKMSVPWNFEIEKEKGKQFVRIALHSNEDRINVENKIYSEWFFITRDPHPPRPLEEVVAVHALDLPNFAVQILDLEGVFVLGGGGGKRL